MLLTFLYNIKIYINNARKKNKENAPTQSNPDWGEFSFG
jgi:hypothetical protein